MVKQLQIEQNEIQINIVDFQLLKSVRTHPKIEVNVAISMFDMLSKLYLSSIMFYQLPFQQIQLLLIRFITSNQIQEFTFNLVKIANPEYYANYQEHIKSNPKSILNRNPDVNIKRQQLKSQIVSLIKFIINLRSFELNELIKPVIAHFYLEIQWNLKTELQSFIYVIRVFWRSIRNSLGRIIKIKQINSLPQNPLIQSQIVKSQIQRSLVQQNFNYLKSNKGIISQRDDPFKAFRDDASKPILTMLQNLSLNNDGIIVIEII